MASTMADCLHLQPNNTQSCSPLMQRGFISEPGSSASVYKGSYCKRMTLKNQVTEIQSNNNRSLNYQRFDLLIMFPPLLRIISCPLFTIFRCIRIRRVATLFHQTQTTRMQTISLRYDDTFRFFWEISAFQLLFVCYGLYYNSTLS